MDYAYGKSIAVPVRAFAGDTPVAIDSIVGARIYPDVPTEAQKLDSDGSEGGFTGSLITSFSATDATNLIYTVTFDPIDDPDQDSGNLYDIWHVVANVLLESGEQEQALYKAVVLWKVVPQFSQLSVSASELYYYEGEIETVLGATETGYKITAATNRVLAKIKFLELDRHKLKEVDLNLAVTYKALELCLMDLSTDENNYMLKAEKYEKKFDEIWSELSPGYDSNSDGVVEPFEKVKKIGSVKVFR